tara:strand:- start:250 stop:651 length:402 start_codon:yes stop_codon:yes gene_type:complete
MRKNFKLGSLKPGVVKTVKKIIDESKAKKQDKARVKKMGGGMMGRRMGYSEGTKPISRSKNPGLLAMSKTAKGKEAVKKMKFNPNRIVAKDGTNPFNKQKNIIDKQGKRGIIVGTGTMQKAPSKVSTKRKSSR